jgi:hypothetical protein
MRIVLAASILVLTSGIAFAQKEKLRPAPVPGDNPGDRQSVPAPSVTK